ncbi:MAG: orotidine-5'-phosphate decarboxylase [Alphaproteobacteria bacterium]|nr:orotidine-5'-phosphate decarboxylase [Alphaproteobacteria bacterium]
MLAENLTARAAPSAEPAPNPVFVAIDRGEVADARALITALQSSVGGVKLGLEFFIANGPDGVRAAMSGVPLPLFLDLKLHDIPNTVAAAVRSVSPLAPAFVTIHAGGGEAMMRAAAEAKGPGTRLLGVTVLTSLSDRDLAAVGQHGPASEQARRLAELAISAGLDGVVCSPHEVAMLRSALGTDPVLMVPGIRPAGTAVGDQKRVMPPADALAAGASHLVIGRPITEAPDPAAAARAIAESLRQS